MISCLGTGVDDGFGVLLPRHIRRCFLTIPGYATLHMGWAEVFKQSLGLLGGQRTPSLTYLRHSSPFPSHKADPRELHFTKNALSKMSQWGLSEADIKDVFFHGGVLVKEHMIVKKYPWYEISLYCLQDKRTGQFIISSAWKRGRY
jgi:hypothetical protein